MLFNSLEFIFLFLPITLIGFFVIGSLQQYRVAIAWLVSASLFFYSYWNPAYLGLLIFSLLFNYGAGIVLFSRHKSKLILALCIGVNLGLLGYFKYTNFFIDNINQVFDTSFNVTHIILPLAISFFTFQQIAYLVDAYRNETHEYNFLHYALFVTFFPQLIAGPIVHHKEMLPQFSQRKIYTFNLSYFSAGLTLFTIGLSKKVLLADTIGIYSNKIFAAAEAGNNISLIDAWGAAIAYALQLYFDFSGYADMAIGLALMFGIHIAINFNSPYKSVNIIEFWRTWHMTLSRFLRDYLYISLGGNRKGPARRHINILVTMLLGGLWHGAAWNFVIWGGLHGLFLVINHLWRQFRSQLLKQDLSKSTMAGRFISVIITFLLVSVSWVFFRAESLDGAMQIITAMAGNNHIVPADYYITPGTVVIGFTWNAILLLFIFFSPNSQQLVSGERTGFISNVDSSSTHEDIKSRISPLMATLYGILLFFCIKKMLTFPETEFLYFNF